MRVVLACFAALVHISGWGQSWLVPVTVSPHAWVGAESFVSWQAEQALWLNRDQATAWRQLSSFRAQACHEAPLSDWCIGLTSRQQQAKADLQYDVVTDWQYIERDEQIYASLHQSIDTQTQLVTAIGTDFRHEPSLALGVVASNYDLWWQQHASQLHSKMQLDFLLLDNRQSLLAEQTYQRQQTGGLRVQFENNYALSIQHQGYQTASATTAHEKTMWLEPRYDGLYLIGQQQSWQAAGRLSLQDQPKDDRDRWQLDMSSHHYQLGYQWHRQDRFWAGVYQYQRHLTAQAKLMCQGKHWSQTLDNRLLCNIFTGGVIYAQATGAMTLSTRGMRMGRTFATRTGQWQWDNLVVEAQLDYHDSQYLAKFGSREQLTSTTETHWLWVLNLDWQRQWRNWSVGYQWQQIIPLNELRTLSLHSNDKASTSQAEAPSQAQVNKNWLWPLLGGYHQLNLRYSW